MLCSVALCLTHFFKLCFLMCIVTSPLFLLLRIPKVDRALCVVGGPKSSVNSIVNVISHHVVAFRMSFPVVPSVDVNITLERVNLFQGTRMKGTRSGDNCNG